MLASLLLLVAGLRFGLSAKYRDTDSLDNHGFLWLGKFCYDWNGHKKANGHYKTAGVWEVNLSNRDKVEMTGNNWTLVLFEDQQSSFHYVYPWKKHSLTCQQRISRNHSAYRHVIQWNDNGKFKKTIEIRDHLRPRFWWGYVVNCNPHTIHKDPKIHFSSHFHQYKAGAWNKELGMNEMGLNTVYSVFLGVYCVYLGLQFYAYQKFKISNDGNVHLVVKLLIFAITMQLVSIMFHFVDFTVYTETGYRQLWAEVFGNVFEITASSTFLLQLLVMASGWTITDIDFAYKKHAAICALFLMLLKIGFWMWRAFGLDPEKTEYFYDSLPMYIYGALMAAVGVVFIGLIVNSYLKETLWHKKQLYLAIGALYSVWFAVPLGQIPIGKAFDPWLRDVATTSLELSIDTLAFGMMTVLLWPKWASRYFQLDESREATRILPEVTIQGDQMGKGDDCDFL